MYDEFFNDVKYDESNIKNKTEINEILKTYIDKYYSASDDKDTWFNKIKDLSKELGYSPNVKDYKENPEKYKGSVADVSTVIRIALTSSTMTPDLYEIMNLLGSDRIKSRINMYINK